MAVAAYAGQDVLKIHLKDGSTQTIAVSAIDSLTFEQMQSAGTKYYIIAFGYQGKATTPLFKQEVTTTGEAETGGGNGGWGF